VPLNRSRASSAAAIVHSFCSFVSPLIFFVFDFFISLLLALFFVPILAY